LALSKIPSTSVGRAGIWKAASGKAAEASLPDDAEGLEIAGYLLAQGVYWHHHWQSFESLMGIELEYGLSLAGRHDDDGGDLPGEVGWESRWTADRI
jgi:hypothetical protein